MQISPDTRKTAPAYQALGRPTPVPDIAGDERNTPIMASAPHIRIPAQRQPEPTHQPWCDDHIEDDSGFGTCTSVQIVAPGQMIRLLWAPGEGVQADIAAGDRIDLISLDELEQRALAMLTLALTGRGITPPATALSALASTVTS